jgi:hypothetical protein
MNPAYNRTLSLLVEIKSNIPGKGDGSSREPDDLGPLGKATPSYKKSTNPKSNADTADRGKNYLPDVHNEYLNAKSRENSKAKKSPLWKKMLGVFMRKFGRNKPK